MKRWVVVIETVFLVGCAGYRPAAGVRETIQQPLHAETGMGITVWKIPIIGIGGWGFPWWYSYGGLPVIEYNYNYQAVPPMVPQGGVPAQPPGPPQSVSYRTVYKSAPFDDPTLAVFLNTSHRATRVVTIDDREPIVLEPGRVTANIRLPLGDHQVMVRGTIPTYFGPAEIPEKVFSLRVEALGRPHIIHLSEY